MEHTTFGHTDDVIKKKAPNPNKVKNYEPFLIVLKMVINNSV